MSYSLLIKNIDTLNNPESESFISVKQEIDEMVDFRNKSMLGESIPNEFSNEENDERNGQVRSEEVFLTTWNSHSVKPETVDDFNAGYDSAVNVFSNLGVKKELNFEEEMKDSYSIREKHCHLQNENTGYRMTKIEEASEICSSIQLKLVQDKCDILTSMNSMHSVKTEANEDIDTNEDNKCIMNQIDENGKVWPEEGFSTSLNFQSVKMERSEDFSSKTECTKSKKQDESEIISSIQMKQGPQKSDLDSIHLKQENHKCYLCHLCDFSSSWRATLHEHIKSVHIKLQNRKCYLCDYSSSLKGNLLRHIESVHLKLNNHKCHSCDYSSSQEANLRTHIKSVHLNLKNHKCHLCDFSTSLKAALQRHIKSVHLKLRSHKCHLCDYSSSQKAAVQRHIKSIHLKQRNH